MVEPTQTDSAVRRLCAVSDFFAQAEKMRAVFDERMGRKRSIGKESFVWDYWHIPGQYTYLRTFGDGGHGPASATILEVLMDALGGVRPPGAARPHIGAQHRTPARRGCCSFPREVYEWGYDPRNVE
jgi:hypothetical protein